jgi:ficolin
MFHHWSILVLCVLCVLQLVHSQLVGTVQTKPARTCFDIFRQNPSAATGVYWLRPSYNVTTNQLNAFQAYCDMDDKDQNGNSGWTVIQRREPSTSGVSFYRNWAEYKAGFGSAATSYYLGNENIFALSTYELSLRIDLFYLDVWYKADFAKFSISSETDKYRLYTTGFTSPTSPKPGDSFTPHSGFPFSTYDVDNDDVATASCAVTYKGAWWYNSCHSR